MLLLSLRLLALEMNFPPAAAAAGLLLLGLLLLLLTLGVHLQRVALELGGWRRHDVICKVPILSVSSAHRRLLTNLQTTQQHQATAVHYKQ
jgi:hypothetical protein